MASPESLTDLYTDELSDLWSANDQMQAVMKQLSDKVGDDKLKKTLAASVGGIGKHTEVLKALLEAADPKSKKELCRGMEGLVREAKKHALTEAPSDEILADLVIISQYQRMSHYGLAGFGTAAAYAAKLGRKDDETKLKSIVADIYKADEFTNRMAERLEKAAVKKAA
jgi:ferritin-like metal-binding protein YciE